MGMVVAQLGVSLGVLTRDLFAVVLFVAVATTMLAPPFLKRVLAGEEHWKQEIAELAVSTQRWSLQSRRSSVSSVRRPAGRAERSCLIPSGLTYRRRAITGR
jgi:hypothetical protein